MTTAKISCLLSRLGDSTRLRRAITKSTPAVSGQSFDHTAGDVLKRKAGMVLSERYPIFPKHGLGFIYGRDESEIVVWAEDKSFEAPPGKQASEADLADFAGLLDSLRGLGLPNWQAVHQEILNRGWEDRGWLRYEIQSGQLFVDALVLAEIADGLWAERTKMFEVEGGTHPEVGSELWPRWVTVTTRRHATARGARVLSLAAVEALVNELLAARFPEQYDEWEIKGTKRSFWKKLRGLLELKDVADPEPEWFRELAEHGGLRDRTLHHQPRWIRDVRNEDSVDPDHNMTQERLHATLTAVEHAIVGLFGLFDAEVPVTHRRDWVTRIS
jgi:hypothetical protein